MKKLIVLFVTLLATGGSSFAQQLIFPVAGVATVDVSPAKAPYEVLVNATVTSVVFTNQTPGQLITVMFLQDSTGHAVTFGGNILNACSVSATANALTSCQFQYDARTVQWAGLGGSVGGSSAASTAGLIDPTQTPYNVKADAISGNDGTSTNGSPTFSSTNQSCNAATDIGKLMVAVRTSDGAYPYGVGLVAVLGCNGNSWTLSGNAGASAGAAQNWFLGTATGTGLKTAYQAALVAGKVLALPCGGMVVEIQAPFTPATGTLDYFLSRQEVQGCNATAGTVFFLHPNITVGGAGGPLLANLDNSVKTGAINYNGLPGQNKISNFMVTTASGVLIGNSQLWALIQSFNIVDNVTIQGFGIQNGSTFVGINGNGESRYDKLNFQNYLGTNATYKGVVLSGQGQNIVSNSIFAFGLTNGIECITTVNCASYNNYFTAINNGVTMDANGSILTFVGNVCSANGPGSQHGCITDAGGNTLYVFGNSMFESVASISDITVGAGSILDISGSTVSAQTSGFSISGTGTVNDRAGNTFNGPLTQFTGKYVPIGGGSVATSAASATTNFGANLGATNIVTASPGTATYDTKIGFRQVTLGVGCGAGSNTVNGVLSWTAGGVVQTTGAGGVPALGTLTISANGAVGSSSAYSSVPVHVDINTAISFTTTSVLVSAGCGTIPQYVVDFSNI